MADPTIDQSGSLTFDPGDAPVTCSFEIGDWLSTVSAGNTSQSAIHTVVGTSVSEEAFEATHRVGLASGTALVDQTERFDRKLIRRQFRVTPEDTVDFGDFVVRFVREATAVDHVEIAGREFEHRGRNRYLQFETDSVDLVGSSTDVRISLEEACLPRHVQPVIYARDEPTGDWIVHVRALTTDGEGFLRLYPGPLNRSALLDRITRVGGLRDVLRYVRERAPVPGRWVPLQYVHTTELTGDDEIRMDVAVEFDSET